MDEAILIRIIERLDRDLQKAEQQLQEIRDKYESVHRTVEVVLNKWHQGTLLEETDAKLNFYQSEYFISAMQALAHAAGIEPKKVYSEAEREYV